MDGEKEVGGLRCAEVLARLSDFLDGALEDGEQRAVEAHVQGCTNCERFGGAFILAVRALRSLGAAKVGGSA